MNFHNSYSYSYVQLYILYMTIQNDSKLKLYHAVTNTVLYRADLYS